MFGFYLYEGILRRQNNPTVVLGAQNRFLAEIFASEKNRIVFCWREYFATQSWLLSFMACDKNCPSLFLYKKYRISQWITDLLKTLDNLICLAVNLTNLPVSLSMMAGISSIKFWSSIYIITSFCAALPLKSRLDSSKYFRILCTVHSLALKDSDIFVLAILVRMSWINLSVSKFMVEWIVL